MAFPVIAAGNTSTNASGTSHTVNLPTGIVAGNLLVVVFGGSAAATLTWPAGWTEFLTGGATGGVLNAAYKFASGSEGSTITVTSGATSLTSNTRSYRITGSGEAPQAGVNVTISSSATGDPPSLTPTWTASLDILWIAISFASTQSTVSTYPTSYTNTAVLANGSTGLATCNLNATGTVQDPAAFTWGGTGRKNTNTIAIKPGFPFVATLASAGLTGFGPAVSGSESPTTASVGLTGFSPGVNGPKGAFSHTYINAGFWPSRRYGSFNKGGAGSVSITPARAALGFIGIASPLAQGLIIAPAMGSLALTGFAPLDIIAMIIAPSLGSAGFTGISSTLRVENIIRGPPLAALAMTGTVPTVAQGAMISAQAGSLSATGQPPSVGQSYAIIPSKADLLSSGGIFSLLTGAGAIPAPGLGAFSGNPPSLKFELFLTPPVGSLSASGSASGSSRSITPPAGSITATGLASVMIQAAVIVPPAGSGSFAVTIPSLLVGSVGKPPAGSLGVSGFGSLIQLVTFVPPGSLSFAGKTASVSSTGIQTQRTQLGPRFIPAKRYKLQGFANKFGTQQALISAAAINLSGYVPTIIKSYVPALAPLAVSGYAPTVSISTAGDRFVTPPVGSLSASGQSPTAIRGSTKKTQLSARFIPGRCYGRFDSKAGINISVIPPCGSGIRINYLVDGLGNYIVDENGNYILSYNDQAGTTAVFNSFLPKVQLSTLFGITISPTRGSLTGTSAAPSVKVDRFITPTKGDLTAAGNAPTASVSIVIKPTTGALGISGTAPNSGVAYVFTPPAGSIQAAGLLSTVFVGAGTVTGFLIAPNNALLSATGFQSITKTAALIPQGQIALGGFAPTVSQSIVIIPPRAQVFALGQFPVPARDTQITPPAGSLSQSSAAPLQSIVTFVPAAQLAITGYAPFVTTETGLRITSGSLTVTGFPPAQIATLSAPAGQASFTGFSPQIPKLFIPAAGQMGITGFAPLFKLPEVILINLKGAAVATLTLSGQLIGTAPMSGQAVATIVIKPKE